MQQKLFINLYSFSPRKWLQSDLQGIKKQQHVAFMFEMVSFLNYR